MKNSNLLVAGAAVLLIGVGVAATTQPGGAVPTEAQRTIHVNQSERTISVAATVVHRVLPDVIIWHLSTTDTDPDLLSAKAASDEKLKNVLAARDKLNIGLNDCQVCQVRISVKTDRNGRFVGHTVQRNITIRLTDLTRFDEFFDMFAEAQPDQLSFTQHLASIEKIREKVRLDSFGEALRKATVAAEQLGAKIGVAITIDDTIPAATTAGYGQGRSHRTNANADITKGTAAPSAIAVRSSVRAVFALE